jgi:hypothetical protein
LRVRKSALAIPPGLVGRIPREPGSGPARAADADESLSVQVSDRDSERSTVAEVVANEAVAEGEDTPVDTPTSLRLRTNAS